MVWETGKKAVKIVLLDGGTEPGKMAAEMSKKSSQVAPGQLEDYGTEVG